MQIIEAREKTNDKEYFRTIVETNPLLIEWANEDIRNKRNKKNKNQKLN